MIKTAPDQYPEIRDAVRAPCAEYPDEYHRSICEQRGYPEAFVDALIPQEYGCSGLGLAEASAIVDDINRSSCNPGAHYGHIYNMGTLLAQWPHVGHFLVARV